MWRQCCWLRHQSSRCRAESFRYFTGITIVVSILELTFMALTSELEILNRVLRDLSGCFLQYVGECWPWTAFGSDGNKQRNAVMQCVERQRQSIGLIASFLNPKQDRVEFGDFSTDYTDLHYVSLQFLVKRLVESQQKLVESADRSLAQLSGAEAARIVMSTVVSNERANLVALQVP